MSSHGVSQLTIPSSPAYLLPPRDVVSRHLSFPREFAALAHSRSALAPSTLPKDLPDAVVSQPLPPPGNNPPVCVRLYPQAISNFIDHRFLGSYVFVRDERLGGRTL